MNQNQAKITLGSLIEKIPGRNSGIDCIGPSGSDKAYLAFRIYQEHKIPLMIIVPSAKEAKEFLDDLHFFLKKLRPPVIYFPPYNILPFKDLAYHGETVAKRISSLYRLTASEVSPIVVTTVDALLHKIIPKQELLNYVELIMAGEDIDRDLFVAKLLSGGYVQAMIVEEPGDFCVRGGILDVFSPLYSDPLRIELFGNTVDSLRFFSAASQRTTKKIQEAVILPAKETILKKECLDEIISRIRKQASALDLPVTKVRDLVNRVRNEGVFPGIESLIPLIYPELDSFFDYVPNHAMYILINSGELEKAAAEFQKQLSDNFSAACNQGRLCVEPHQLYLEWPRAQNILISTNPLTVKMLPMSKGDFDGKQSFLEVEPKQRAHSPQLAAGLASELKQPLFPTVDAKHCRKAEHSPQLAAGSFNSRSKTIPQSAWNLSVAGKRVFLRRLRTGSMLKGNQESPHSWFAMPVCRLTDCKPCWHRTAFSSDSLKILQMPTKVKALRTYAWGRFPAVLSGRTNLWPSLQRMKSSAQNTADPESTESLCEPNFWLLKI